MKKGLRILKRINLKKIKKKHIFLALSIVIVLGGLAKACLFLNKVDSILPL